ncbi:MAG: nucleotidyltransferase family protein [Candidatus Thermoplasmatota archaeon]
MDKDKVYQEITEQLKEEGAVKIAVFGSFVRDEEEKGSDIDILVTFSETKSLLELARIERELSENIGIKVDLLTENSLSPYIRDNVHKEMKEVYG